MTSTNLMTSKQNAFKAARYFLPLKVKSMNPSAMYTDSLTANLFLNNPATITSLKSELPDNLAIS